MTFYLTRNVYNSAQRHARSMLQEAGAGIEEWEWDWDVDVLNNITHLMALLQENNLEAINNFTLNPPVSGWLGIKGTLALYLYALHNPAINQHLTAATVNGMFTRARPRLVDITTQAAPNNADVMLCQNLVEHFLRNLGLNPVNLVNGVNITINLGDLDRLCNVLVRRHNDISDADLDHLFVEVARSQRMQDQELTKLAEAIQATGRNISPKAMYQALIHSIFTLGVPANSTGMLTSGDVISNGMPQVIFHLTQGQGIYDPLNQLLTKEELVEILNQYRVLTDEESARVLNAEQGITFGNPLVAWLMGEYESGRPI